MRPEASEVQKALERVVSSPEWDNSSNSESFLRFIVEQTLAGNGGDLQEGTIGETVFRRQPGYNPRVDSIVRIEAMNLRDNLLKYYEGSGIDDPILIELGAGSYTPVFRSFAEPAKKGKLSFQFKVPATVAAFLLMMAASAYWISQLDGRSLVLKPTGLFTDQKGNSRSPAFSPNGEWIAFSRDLDGVHSNIYLQAVDGGAARLLTFGDAMDYEPAWSADGKRIAFVRQRARGGFSLMLKDVGAQTSSETAVADLTSRSVLDWTKDGGAILAADRSSAALPMAIVRIEIRGGNKTKITTPPLNIAGDSSPRLSPDGRWLAFVRSESNVREDVYLVAISGGPPRRISTRSRRVGGLCWTPDSKAIVMSLEDENSRRALWRYSVDSNLAQIVDSIKGSPVNPSMPAQGIGLAYVIRESDSNLWGMDPGAKGEATRLTSSLEMDSGPKLSPDGRLVAWRSGASGENELWIASNDGSNPRMLSSLKGAVLGPASWSSDGMKLVFEASVGGASQIISISSEGGEPSILLKAKASAAVPSYSKDGTSVYYSTNQNGVWELMRFKLKTNTSELVAGAGAFAGLESQDGKWVYYTRQGQEVGGVYRVPVQGGNAELLVAELSRKLWGHWAVSSKALFYAVFPAAGDKVIRRLDLETRKVTDVTTFRRPPIQFDGGLTVSADEKRLIWSQLDHSGSDVYLLGNYQ